MTSILKYLRAADIFAVLDPDELENLSRDLEVKELVPGQAAVTQGDDGSSLFIIISGQMSVTITDAGSPVHVGDLLEGDFFGEMSLLTGSLRTATVQATTTATLIEVTKSRLTPLMQCHDELAALMGRALSERQGSNLKTLMELERPAVTVEKETVAAQLSWRIQKFFTLPTSIWGKAVDGIAGFSIRGPLGFMLGRTDHDASSGLHHLNCAFGTVFRVHPARRVVGRDAGASQAPCNDAGGPGRPPCGSRFTFSRGVSRAFRCPASHAHAFLPGKRESRSQGCN